MYTILSVSFKSSDYINVNYDVVTRYNKPRDFRWIVIDNHYLSEEAKLTPEPGDVWEHIPLRPNAFDIVQGIERRMGDRAYPKSCHHALALHKGLSLVDTRFVIILDPDFFTVFNFSRLLNWMKEQGLWFFGARMDVKQKFPMTCFQIIDTEKVNVKELDYRPSSIRTKHLQRDAPYEDGGYKVVNQFKDCPQKSLPMIDYRTRAMLYPMIPKRIHIFHMENQFCGIHCWHCMKREHVSEDLLFAHNMSRCYT